jgi:hypothetical protein
MTHHSSSESNEFAIPAGRLSWAIFQDTIGDLGHLAIVEGSIGVTMSIGVSPMKDRPRALMK